MIEVDDDARPGAPLAGGGEVIALEPDGVSWTTEELARQIERRMTHGTRSLTFVIGGADGIPAALVGQGRACACRCRR